MPQGSDKGIGAVWVMKAPLGTAMAMHIRTWVWYDHLPVFLTPTLPSLLHY